MPEREPSPNTWRSRLLTAAALVVLCPSSFYLAVLVSGERQTTADSTSRISEARGLADCLTVDPQNLNFEEQRESSRFEWTFPIENKGNREVTVAKMEGSCDCLSIQPQSFSLKPSEKVLIRLIVDLRSSTDTRTKRPFAAIISPVVQASDGTRLDHRIRWILTGSVCSLIRSPRIASLGSFSELAIPTPVHFHIESSIQLSWITAAVDRDELLVTVVPSDSEGHYTVVVSPSHATTFPRGKYSATIGIVAQPRDGSELVKTEIPLVGHVLDDIQATPTIIAAAARPVGDVLEDTITLSSLTGRPFTVDHISTEGSGISVTCVSDNTYIVRQRITCPGSIRHRIVFSVRSDLHSRFVEIPLTCDGV